MSDQERKQALTVYYQTLAKYTSFSYTGFEFAEEEKYVLEKYLYEVYPNISSVGTGKNAPTLFPAR